MNEPNAVFTDPVCGMIVDTSTALYAELYGQSLYFCSEPCRTRFCPGPPVPGPLTAGDEGVEVPTADLLRRQG